MQKQRIVYNGVRRNLILAISIAFTTGLIFGDGLLGRSTGGMVLPSASAAVTGFPKPAPSLDTIDLDCKTNVTIKIPDSLSGTDAGFPGYEVTVTLLETDPINTPEGYTKAAKLTVNQAKTLNALGRYSAVTNAKGEVNFPELVPGAYLITAKPPKPGGREPQEEVLIAPIVGEDGEWDYSFTAVMKFKNDPKPEPTLPPWIPPSTQTTSPPKPNATPSVTVPVTPPSTPERRVERLPLTGAAVIWLVISAAFLISLGFVFLAVNRRREQSKK
ncbi:LPXTG cell wall anchor domain-containing protein [Corynebacterium ulcerans]|uniref:LPXTG cell wall anchor domain-containing protein n=1 Tax=Corynebacterium ulcerans TaxID=65058 RepID=UPI000C7608CE|nr:LPXTG cell wall anchor domain-containing protein [Corynebacterium ulcerans]PLW02939.1 cell surface protein [Corynebacterium ulcerans]